MRKDRWTGGKENVFPEFDAACLRNHLADAFRPQYPDRLFSSVTFQAGFRRPSSVYTVHALFSDACLRGVHWGQGVCLVAARPGDPTLLCPRAIITRPCLAPSCGSALRFFGRRYMVSGRESLETRTVGLPAPVMCGAIAKLRASSSAAAACADLVTLPTVEGLSQSRLCLRKLVTVFIAAWSARCRRCAHHVSCPLCLIRLSCTFTCVARLAMALASFSRLLRRLLQ